MTRTIVIVGASTGLGREAARALVAAGHRVILAGRDVERTRAAVPGAAEVLAVDLTRQADCVRFARELAGRGPIDALICNAGLQSVGEPRHTPDGHEELFAVNHLGHFAILMRVVPALAPGARVVFIGSGTVDPDDRGARRFGFRGGRYQPARELAAGTGDASASVAQRAKDRYATSKLCNLLVMRAIAERVPPSRLAAFAIDPGLMPGTGLARDYNVVLRALRHTVLRAMPGTSSARRSGAVLAWLATTAELDGTTGRYFDYRRTELEPVAIAQRSDWARALYDDSLALCGLAVDPLAAAAA